MRGRVDGDTSRIPPTCPQERMPADGDAFTPLNLPGPLRAFSQRIGGANKMPPFFHEAFTPRGNLRGDPSPKLRVKISP